MNTIDPKFDLSKKKKTLLLYAPRSRDGAAAAAAGDSVGGRGGGGPRMNDSQQGEGPVRPDNYPKSRGPVKSGLSRSFQYGSERASPQGNLRLGERTLLTSGNPSEPGQFPAAVNKTGRPGALKLKGPTETMREYLRPSHRLSKRTFIFGPKTYVPLQEILALMRYICSQRLKEPLMGLQWDRAGSLLVVAISEPVPCQFKVA